MRVYRVRGAVNGYQSLGAHDNAVWQTQPLWLDGTPLAGDWIPPSVHSNEPRLKVPDIWTLVGCAGFVFPPAIVERLATVLGTAGELLPLRYQRETLFLLNTLQDINCLDHHRTSWTVEALGVRASPTTYAFHPHRIPGSTLFKIPETDRAEVLCVEGIRDRHDEFKATVEDAGWKGLIFDLLWDSQPKMTTEVGGRG